MDGFHPTDRAQVFNRAISYLSDNLPSAISNAATMSSGPVLFDANNRPMPPARYEYSKRGAATTGSLRKWSPQRLQADQITRQRESITSRIQDLIGSDYNAAGVVQTFPITVIGSGLTPYPSLDGELLGIPEEQANDIETAQRRIFSRWSPHADVAGRRFGEVQFLWERCLIQFGEALTLVQMKRVPGRRYRLRLRVIHPSRMKTPSDKRQSNILDGVEVNDDGQPIAVWVKRTDDSATLTDNSANFHRINIMRGHRYQVLHDFYCGDPEQVRGRSPLAPLIKGFKDLSDFLDAELVSNVVTAAFSIFIELQQPTNPYDVAGNMSHFSDTSTNGSGQAETTRYQRLDPGAIMYGNTGEKPHAISANRPGTTFEPFVHTLKKSFSHGLNIPYPVMFHDVDGISHAGFRSAMLEAWRVFTYRRNHIGRGSSQKTYNMLMEEAWLMGDLPVPGPAAFFYDNLDAICGCEWYGAPKGDIEPYKAIKTDLLAHEGNIKTRERIILENGGGNPTAVIRQIEKEKKDAIDRGIAPAQTQTGADSELAGQNISADAIADAVVDAMEAQAIGV